MFFRAHKHKKIADAVLGQVTPLLTVVRRFGDIAPAKLASDKYVLGFLWANIGFEMQRAGGSSLSQAGRGTVAHLVLQNLFGPGVINTQQIADLMLAGPTPDAEFKRGIEAAAKIQAVGSGHHNLQNDPAYLAAKDFVRRAGSGLDIVSPGASEDSKIAGEMLRMLYYQHVIDNHKTS